ncbi:MAG: hypothetical protein HY874_03080 [Chloroflexi bacterium]|nr:hypothetical protein [Chloroflexota bacterium]
MNEHLLDRLRSLRRAGVRCGVATILTALASAQIQLVHLASVDVSSTTLPTSPTFVGTSAANIAWNGADLCLAGWNAGMATSVAIVRITNVYGAPVFGTPFASVPVVSGFGYTGLDLQGAQLAAPLDTNSTSPNGLTSWDTSGNLLWSFTARCTSGAAFDPDHLGAMGAGSGVGWVSFGSGRRALNDATNGAEIYSIANGMIINSSSGTTWRDLDFDETTGDVYLRKSNDVVRCVRTGSNACVSSVLVNRIDSTQPRQNVAVLNSDSGTYVVYNDRFTNATGQSYSTVIQAADTNGVSVPIDWGAFAPPTSNAAYDFGWDSGSDTLAILDVTHARVDLFHLGPPTPATPFCVGDGSATICPCGNASPPGAPEGCLNSLGSGARLEGNGLASLVLDTFRLAGSGMPNSTALYLQGDAQEGAGLGTVLGDGLRCVGGAIIRLGTKTNVAGSSGYPDAGNVPISIRGAVPAGATRHYQVWYRNAAAFCTTSTFNLSNGVSATWAP